LSGFVPFPELAHFREMPCGGFAQEFCGGGITHELGDLEAELGLAAMMASIVHSAPVFIVLVRPGRAKYLLTGNGIGVRC
jgi:hypothetical protein